jgi:glutathione S-transferase
VIADGEVVIYESCIINEYLEEKYPERPLMPTDHAKRAKIRILIDYGLNHFAPPYQRLREEMRWKAEKERDRQIVESAVKDLVNLFQRFEQEIGENSYLAGDFSLLIALIPRYLRMENGLVSSNPALPRRALAQQDETGPSVQTFSGNVSARSRRKRFVRSWIQAFSKTGIKIAAFDFSARPPEAFPVEGSTVTRSACTSRP